MKEKNIIKKRTVIETVYIKIKIQKTNPLVCVAKIIDEGGQIYWSSNNIDNIINPSKDDILFLKMLLPSEKEFNKIISFSEIDFKNIGFNKDYGAIFLIENNRYICTKPIIVEQLLALHSFVEGRDCILTG